MPPPRRRRRYVNQKDYDARVKRLRQWFTMEEITEGRLDRVKTSLPAYKGVVRKRRRYITTLMKTKKMSRQKAVTFAADETWEYLLKKGKGVRNLLDEGT